MRLIIDYIILVANKTADDVKTAREGRVPLSVLSNVLLFFKSILHASLALGTPPSPSWVCLRLYSTNLYDISL